MAEMYDFIAQVWDPDTEGVRKIMLQEATLEDALRVIREQSGARVMGISFANENQWRESVGQNK